MKYLRALRAAAVILGVVASGGLARAGSIVFSDFGSPGTLYQAASGVPLTGYTTPSSFVGFLDQAFAFTPSASFTFTELDIALTYVSGTNDGVVSLWTDSGGEPGTTLAGWITGSVPAFGGCCTYQSFIPVPSLTLLAGQQYWILAAANGYSNQLMWNLNSLGVTGPQATSVDQGPYSTSTSVEGDFQVLGTAVPEPSSVALSVLGFAVMAWYLKKSDLTVLALTTRR